MGNSSPNMHLSFGQPPFGDYASYKNADDWGMVNIIGLTMVYRCLPQWK